jgi:hypothetical protein
MRVRAMLTNSPKEYGHDWAYYVKSQTIKLNCSLLHKTIKIIKLKCPLLFYTSRLQLTATLLHLWIFIFAFYFFFLLDSSFGLCDGVGQNTTGWVFSWKVIKEQRVVQ